jgi:hypothetical protein
MNDAQVGDIYVDKNGKLWRVIETCSEPTVNMQEIEHEHGFPPNRQRGGISGLMWNGFKRIYRHQQP